MSHLGTSKFKSIEMKSTKTPISYYGGKQTMLPCILPLIPDHAKYTEPFFGGGALFFAKKRSRFEVINDLSREAITFYKVLQTRFEELRELVNSSLHSRAQYKDATIIYQNPHLFSDLHRAWAFWFSTQCGFSSQVGFWGLDQAKNTVALKLTNKKLSFCDHLKIRLEGVQIECKDAVEVVKQYDSPGTFHYIDPPYPNSECAHYKGYSFADLERLLIVLRDIEGKFLLSNYNSEMLDSHIANNGWCKKEVTKKVAVSHKVKKEKVEVLVANYEI
jgi:DNA adenine methylase